MTLPATKPEVVMDRWIIYHEDGSQEHRAGSREEIAEYLEEKYTGKHVEAFTDQILVYEQEVAAGDTIGCDPIASAVPE